MRDISLARSKGWILPHSIAGTASAMESAWSRVFTKTVSSPVVELVIMTSTFSAISKGTKWGGEKNKNRMTFALQCTLHLYFHAPLPPPLPYNTKITFLFRDKGSIVRPTQEFHLHARENFDPPTLFIDEFLCILEQRVTNPCKSKKKTRWLVYRITK